MLDKDKTNDLLETLDTIEKLEKILKMENFSDEEKIENVRLMVEEKLQKKVKEKEIVHIIE